MDERARHELAERRQVNLDRLRELVGFGTVGAIGGTEAAFDGCAQFLMDLLGKVGLHRVERIEIDDSRPYVFAETVVSPELPTVLLYAHYDVQPTGLDEHWETDPFTAEIRSGRLYGRGTADDKGGVMVHIAALEAWNCAIGGFPLNVKVLLDGEEEVGNPTLRKLLREHGELLRADSVLIPDSQNPATGLPALTCSTRGTVSTTVTVEALNAPVHSGFWGGIAPDPVIALCRALGTLVDDDGVVAVDGLEVTPEASGGELAHHPRDESLIRDELGTLPGADLWGDSGLDPMLRAWYRPSVSVLGLDVPSVAECANAIQGKTAARVSMRTVFGQDPVEVNRQLEEHLRREIPWGLQVGFTPRSGHAAWRVDMDSPVVAAALRALEAGFGRPSARLAMGASVPLVNWIAEALGEVPVLLTAVGDPASQPHGYNESLDLNDWYSACLAETVLLDELSRVVTS